VIEDPAFYRPAEPYPLVADPTHAHNQLGWKPSLSFNSLIQMMVKADLAKLQK